MVDSILQWSLANRSFVIVGAIVLTAWGIYVSRSMPVDVFPDLTAPTVTIATEAHGLAPEEVEKLVTFPIESALNGSAGIRRVRSSTSVGMSLVWAEFDWGTDIYVARQVVTEKLQMVQSSLPPDLAPPVLAPISSIMGEILFVGLSSDTAEPSVVRTAADWIVRRRLLAVPGVAQVVTIGGLVQQFQVVVRPRDLVRHQVTTQEVVRAVTATNENTSAGFMERGGQEYLIYGLGRVGQLQDIANAIVRPRSHGIPLRVMDVADVVAGHAFRRGDAAVNGKAGVVLAIQKQPNVNTLALSERLDQVLADLQSQLPKDVVLHPRLLRQADFIEASVENVSHALRDGAILVILIVGIFLLSGRATLITAVTIPISLVVTIIVLRWLGISLNTMTMGGMAIAVGALVDDAIIDVENVVRRLRERAHGGIETSTALSVVFEASKEIRGSIVFATAIIVLVFVPLFFLEGVEGRLLEPLGWAYIVSLTASLFVALTVTPVLCSLLLPNSRMVLKGTEPIIVRGLRRGYETILRPTLGLWPLWVVISLASVSVATVSLLGAGRTFLPEFNEGALTVTVVTLPGTTLEESSKLAHQVEAVLLTYPEVVATATRTGRAELDEHTQPVSSSEIEVTLTRTERTDAEFLTALRADFAGISGANIVIGQPLSHRIDHMLSGSRANIAVKLFGPDLAELTRLATLVESEMETIPGVVDLSIDQQANIPMVKVRLDREALARVQLTVHDVLDTIETLFYGKNVSRVLTGPYAVDMVVRGPEDSTGDLASIRATRVPTPSGAWVPLESLADIQRDRGPGVVTRENGERKVVVMANVAPGADLGGVVDAIRDRIHDKITLDQGYHVEYGGQFEAAEDAAKTLSILSVLVIVGIFLLLFVALKSIRDTWLVMLNLPLALIGGVAGVSAAGGVISIASMIGFVTLFGIATRNGIMLVTHIRHLVEEEGVMEPVQAVLQGASERLVPILMTALASGLGLLPLALAMGEPGSEIQAPMAMVILFGLGSSTLLNMFVVPALTLRFGSIRKLAKAKSVR